MATWCGSKYRDTNAPYLRRMLLERMGMVPLEHQASVWMALDGCALTDTTLASWDHLDAYLEDEEAHKWEPGETQDVMLSDFLVERREVVERAEGRAEFVSDLAAFKSGKSAGGAWYVAAELLCPGVKWELVGIEYDACVPEFEYVMQALCSAEGLDLPIVKRGNPPPNQPLFAQISYRPEQGRMFLRLSNGSELRGRSWDREASLKGKMVDGYLFAEYYQLPGIRVWTDNMQNVAARKGKGIACTTPDAPHIEVLHDYGERKDLPEYFTVHSVPRSVNPTTFSEEKMKQAKKVMTTEKFNIGHLGLISTYIGSVYSYHRGERLFTPKKHPFLFKPGAGENPTLDDLNVPPNYDIVGGADTGTMYTAAYAAFDPEGFCYVISETPNYRYVGNEIERDPTVSLQSWYATLKNDAGMIGAILAFYADHNTQFDQEMWLHGKMAILPGENHPEARTEVAREYFQHDKILFAPWLEVLPYEVEMATYPPEETSTGRWRRIKENDHTLDCLEHILAQRPKGRRAKPKRKRLWVEQQYGVRVGQQRRDRHFG